MIWPNRGNNLRLLTAMCISIVLLSGDGFAQTDCKAMAHTAVNDLLKHFWTGDPVSGHILNTYGGVSPPKYDPRGVLWERSQFLCLLENYWEATHDKAILGRIQSDWKYLKSVYKPDELASCGVGSKNRASDDAAWSTWMYLKVYQATGDPESLSCAKALANATFSRWFSTDFGGGLWYSDDKTAKGLYMAANALGFLKLYEITGERSYLNHAMLCYNWMEEKFLRPDGLYWMGYTAGGPQGANNPHSYGEAGSCVYLGGAMAMGVLHARLFKITGNDMYRARALRTAKALRVSLVDSRGIFIDDRDAWDNGMFCGDWAREVLTLPGIDPLDIETLKNTAAAIFARDRTGEGLFGACWDGPVTEPNPWSKSPTAGSIPKQIMTSASAAAMIVGAANLP